MPPYFLNSRLIMAADEFKDKTKAINKLWHTDDSHQKYSDHRDPKQALSDFIIRPRCHRRRRCPAGGTQISWPFRFHR
jgi:hypothetical protein